MKSKAQIEQRISQLKEREKDVDVHSELSTLTTILENDPLEGDIWDRIASIATSDEGFYDICINPNRKQEDLREIRILLWILED